MIKRALLEMKLFKSAKETENRLRWDTIIENTKFSMYIPKWRVPKPWPSSIWVQVIPRRIAGDDTANLSPSDVESDSSLTHEPIISTVSKYSEHSNTIRYRPLGDSQKWEIGEPYVPFPLTFSGSDRLRILVLWDITSRGKFQNQESLTEG